MPEYSIYALKYAGPFVRATPLMVWFKDQDQKTTISYYIFAARNAQGETLLIDAGVRPEEAAQRGTEGYVSPATVLARLDVRADEIRHVILTHLHWDHASGISLFPRAKFYVQREEFRFWVKDPLAKRPPFANIGDAVSAAELGAMEGTDRLVLLDGDAAILPGIEVWLAPGHTPAHQTVAVQTAKGQVVLGSDVAHVYRNFREDWPSALITDMRAWLQTYDMLRARIASPDLFFPGHDVELSTRFPSVAEDITRLA
jgi:glyoxylase-like metal-dependent hydrolase (beta-lactamase superfamily II)